jgi:hypothetical protein
LSCSCAVRKGQGFRTGAIATDGYAAGRSDLTQDKIVEPAALFPECSCQAVSPALITNIPCTNIYQYK